MKMKKLKLNILAVGLVSFLITGCLKERAANIDTGNGNTTNVVEFLNTGDNFAAQSSKYPQFYADLGSLGLNQSKTININVSYSGVNTAPADMTVNLAIDAASLTLYNSQNGTTYQIPPADVISFPSSVIIKKGTRVTQALLTVKVTANFDFNKSYAVPIKITSTSPAATISGNFGSAIYAFGVRNQIDGAYKQTGTMIDYASASLTGWYPNETYLVTSGALQVNMYDREIGGYFHAIKSGTALSYYGSFGVQINFNPDYTVASVVNIWGQPSANGRSAELDPSGVNKWDPVTKTLKIKYWMNQPSVIAGHRTSFDETYTYEGVR
jgi:hypothetical protein